MVRPTNGPPVQDHGFWWCQFRARRQNINAPTPAATTRSHKLIDCSSPNIEASFQPFPWQLLCVCRTAFVMRFFSTNRDSRGSMTFPQAEQMTIVGF